MKDIRLLSVELNNFAGVRHFVLDAECSNATVSGRNATGKTTIFNAVTWLLFGKNAKGEEKFSVRPLDAAGQRVHNIDITVEATLQVAGESIVLKKTSREKWVKRRGAETAQYTGSENIYEINGYPRKESEYKAFISDLIDEDAFRMLTSPTHFASMPWKKQREILMLFVDTCSDAELAERLGGFDDLIPELRVSPSLDSISAKFRGLSKELSRRQDEIPVRIDELNAMIAVGDIKVLKAHQESLIGVGKQHDEWRETLANDLEAIKKAERVVEDYERQAKADAMQDVYAASKEVGDITGEIATLNAQLTKYGAEVAIIDEKTKVLTEKYEEAKTQLAALDDLHWDDSAWDITKVDTTCPTCGREFPQEKKQEILDKWEGDHEKAFQKFLADKAAQGSSLRKAMDDADYECAKYINKVCEIMQTEERLHKDIEELKVKLEAKRAIVEAGAADPDLSSDPVYSYKKAEVLMAQETYERDKALTIKPVNTDELMAVGKQIAKIEKNDEIRFRIDQLRAELMEVSNKIAKNERMIYLLEQFTRKKLELISESVNSRFPGVEFKLFEQQENGGTRETCELTVKGVPYSDLNSSDRIIAGLNVISGLQNLYQARAFIFVDNAETINADRIPYMDNQLILLKVSEDTALKVEVE